MSNPLRTVNTLHIRRPSSLRSFKKGFSLVEVVLAIGVVSFAMMAVVGTLPIGLRSSQESRHQIATANITRQLQGELQQISFNPQSTDDLNVATLQSRPAYFTLEGTRTTEENGYYVASFAVNETTLPGTSSEFFHTDNARTVTVTLSYPKAAPEANRQKSVFSLLLAKQKTD